jgi:hypothetical protein
MIKLWTLKVFVCWFARLLECPQRTDHDIAWSQAHIRCLATSIEIRTEDRLHMQALPPSSARCIACPRNARPLQLRRLHLIFLSGTMIREA